MSQFITLDDYDASIHREILDALLRHDSDVQDSAIIEICEDRAIEEMRGYMDKFYDCDAIFNATGARVTRVPARPEVVLEALKKVQ